MPSKKPVRLVMAESVMRIVRSAAAEDGVTVEQLIMATLVDEEIDPDAPIYLYLRVDDGGNTALVATQDIEPYREHLLALREGRQPDELLIAVELTAGSERGHCPSTSEAPLGFDNLPQYDQVLSGRRLPLQIVNRIPARFDSDKWLSEITRKGFEAIDASALRVNVARSEPSGQTDVCIVIGSTHTVVPLIRGLSRAFADTINN